MWMPDPVSLACRLRQSPALTWFAISARRFRSTDASDSRVVITWMPRAASNERSLTLRLRFTAFSSWPLSSLPPASSPPWAASSTTTNFEIGGACCAAANELAPSAATKTRNAHLLQCINGEAAQQFWEEVRGFLRHHRACECNLPQLLHGYGIGEEAEVSLAAAHLVHGFAGIA